MTLSSDLLPAMQHYALLAAALALLSLSLANVKRRPGVWVWYLVLLLPVAQIGWSLWETIREVNAAGAMRLVGLSCKQSATAWRPSLSR